MFFYQYFAGLGRDDLADAFASLDPFAVSPAELVERVIALGCMPLAELRKPEMWPTIGTVTEVKRAEQTFFVAVSRDAQEISVQEMRAEAYPTE